MRIRFIRFLISSLFLIAATIGASFASTEICAKKKPLNPENPIKGDKQIVFTISGDCPPRMESLKEKERLNAVKLSIKDILGKNIGVQSLNKTGASIESLEKSVMPTQKAPERIQVCSLTVNFDLGSYELKAYEITKIKSSCLDKLTDDIHQISVKISGYTCDLGPERLNSTLSERRARSVEDFIRKERSNFENIEASGKGNCCYLKTRKESRRAEIEIIGYR